MLTEEDVRKIAEDSHKNYKLIDREIKSGTADKIVISLIFESVDFKLWSCVYELVGEIKVENQKRQGPLETR